MMYSLEERAELEVWINKAWDVSMAKGSRKNFRSAVKGYVDFCRLMDYTAFPPTLKSVAVYFGSYVARGNSPGNIAGIMSYLRRHCVEQYMPCLSVMDEKRLSYLRRGLFRLSPRRGTKRAEACTLEVLIALFQAVTKFRKDDKDGPSHREISILTMGMVAHNGLLRSGELLALQVRDVKWLSTTSCRICIRSSKENQFGLPEEVDYGPYAELCGLTCLRDYWVKYKVKTWHPEAPLFTHNPSIVGSPAMSKPMFIKGFRRLLNLARLPALTFSGHSFRAGGATDLYHGKCRPFVLQLQGRWKSDTFWVYVRDRPHIRQEEVGRAFARMTI
jgi:integrase